MARATPHTTMITIHSLDEVPEFTSESEEAAYWATHELGDEILAAMEPLTEDELPPPRQRTRPVSLRLDETTLSRAKKLAELRHIGYQTLLKEFIVERLYEEEKRNGLVG